MNETSELREKTATTHTYTHANNTMMSSAPLLSDQELLDVLSQIDQDAVFAADKAAAGHHQVRSFVLAIERVFVTTLLACAHCLSYCYWMRI